MVKTHAEKIREAVTDLDNPRAFEIIKWIENHYPAETINRQSYQADVIGCSINHSSSHHYPNMPKFLMFDKNTKRYKLANPEEASKTEAIEKSRLVLGINNGLIDGIPVSKMGGSGQIIIPADIREKLKFHSGDLLGLFIKDNVLEVKKVKLKIELE